MSKFSHIKDGPPSLNQGSAWQSTIENIRNMSWP